jgi:hypothetical protein
MRDFPWYEIAFSAIAFVVLMPLLALALLPFGLLGAPMFLSLIGPAMTISDEGGH